MSEEQLAALLAKLQEDKGLQEKLKGVADLDVLMSIAREAGFDISKVDWLRHQANQITGLSYEDLKQVSGATAPIFHTISEGGCSE